MTVPFGPFRLVVSVDRRRGRVVIPQAEQASDLELARLAVSRDTQADRIRWEAEQTLYGSRLV